MQIELLNIINSFTNIQIYGFVFVYFLFLYFALAPIFLYCCKILYKKKYVEKIVTDKQFIGQKKYEIKNAIISIIIFGFSVFPILYLIKKEVIYFIPDTFSNVIIGLVIFSIWNEIHFYTIHRILHIPFFMKYVHKVHHKSKVPSVYSVYNMHWFEALLLSTVTVTIIPFIPISAVAIALYPLVSILFNYAGHCNYRLKNKIWKKWLNFGTEHNAHHYLYKQNYGFASNLIDVLINKLKK